MPVYRAFGEVPTSTQDTSTASVGHIGPLLVPHRAYLPIPWIYGDLRIWHVHGSLHLVIWQVPQKGPERVSGQVQEDAYNPHLIGACVWGGHG